MAKAPDAFRTISEVADWLDTPAHVLRFWESKFTQIKPVKRAGGRRYYRREDMALLGGIKKLLHNDGMTIKAAQQLLRAEGVKHVAGLCEIPLDSSEASGEAPDQESSRLVDQSAVPVQPVEPAAVGNTAMSPEPIAEAEPPEPLESAQPFDNQPVTASAEEEAVNEAPPEPMAPAEADADAPELPFGESAELPSFLKPDEPDAVAEVPEAEEATVEPSADLPSFLTKVEAPREPLGTDIPADPVEIDIIPTPGPVSLVARTPRERLFDRAAEIAPLAKRLAHYGSRNRV